MTVKRPYDPAWTMKRQQIWERDHGVCQVCGLDIVAFTKHCHLESLFYQLGHIVDFSLGGSNDPDNLLVMCTACNQWKPLHSTRAEFEAWKAGGFWAADIEAYMEKEGQIADLMQDPDCTREKLHREVVEHGPFAYVQLHYTGAA